MRNTLVEIFLAIVGLAFAVWLVKVVYYNASKLSEEAGEWYRKRSVTARLNHILQNKSGSQLLEVAVALALAEYHWPKRLPDDDKALATARARHLSNFQSLSSEEITDWIHDQISHSHSIFLNTAMESLEINKTKPLSENKQIS